MCAVPGPPLSLNAEPSQTDCTSVRLSWSSPLAIGIAHFAILLLMSGYYVLACIHEYAHAQKLFRGDQ